MLPSHFRNNALSFPNASPNKNINSDGTSSFELGKQTYLNMFSKSTPPSNTVIAQKKWIGSGASASDVVARRRNTQIGKGSFNLAKNGVQPTISYSNGHDVNLVQRRRMFTRSGGATVPAKCRGHV